MNQAPLPDLDPLVGCSAERINPRKHEPSLRKVVNVVAGDTPGFIDVKSAFAAAPLATAALGA